jgi:menaquinone-dependent protoporphyrinogen oxidase
VTRVLIVYASGEGQTAKIARRMAERARERGAGVEVHDAAALPAGLDPRVFGAAIVAGSIHYGRHQRAIARFVRDHLQALQEMPSAFVSVSLAAASDGGDRVGAQRWVDRLLAQTGWRPTEIRLMAGAFRFTRYGLLKRWLLRRIAKRMGQPTDTRRDYELTDWDDLLRFVDGFLDSLTRGAGPRSPAGSCQSEPGQPSIAGRG